MSEEYGEKEKESDILNPCPLYTGS